MAAIDYTALTDELEAIFKNDDRLEGVAIHVEEEPQMGLADNGGAIAIFMENRTATEAQPLKAGLATRFRLRISIWVVFFNLESFRAARQGRDNLLGLVEAVLMDNRTINDKVDFLWLEGGEMMSARDPGNSVFVSAAECVVAIEAVSSN